jgi:hypothetical protein
MKKFFIAAVMLLALGVNNSSIYAQSVVKEGKTFTVVSSSKKSESVKTEYIWKDSKGVEYPIYISKSGACFVLRISKKTGKEYRQYLPKEVSAQIASELGIEYKPREN